MTFVQIEFLVTKNSFVYFKFVQFECRILRGIAVVLKNVELCQQLKPVFIQFFTCCTLVHLSQMHLVFMVFAAALLEKLAGRPAFLKRGRAKLR